MSLGAIGGVKFKINLWFLLLCPVYFWLRLSETVLVIIAAIIIHELAHLLCAMALGVKIAEIELMPFGGQARMEDFTGMEPDKEVLVALAGPAASLSLAGFFYFLAPLPEFTFKPLFFSYNLILGGFNLLPVLPLDGGRILRAWWSKSAGYRKATSRTAWAGQCLGLALAGLGIYVSMTYIYGVNFIIIGMFVFGAARREGHLLAFSFMRFLLRKKNQLAKAGLIEASQFVARPESLVKDILRNSKPTYYMLIVVVDGDEHIDQVLTESELIEALLEHGPKVTVKDLV